MRGFGRIAPTQAAMFGERAKRVMPGGLPNELAARYSRNDRVKVPRVRFRVNAERTRPPSRR
jgi:hypothetical protein